MEFTKEDHEAISAAIHAAEQRTSGEIVCVLAHSSSDYVHIPLLWASVLALCLPWPLITDRRRHLPHARFIGRRHGGNQFGCGARSSARLASFS
jgi:hypothetical protein